MADLPRTFRLYEELEKAEHAQLSDQSVSYGLNQGKKNLEKFDKIMSIKRCLIIFLNLKLTNKFIFLGDDKTFTAWNGTIIGPQNTNFDNRIYMMDIICGEDYPQKPCQIKFTSKINIPCVNQQNGVVEPSKFHMFKNWNPEYTMEKVLIGLKNEMITNKKLAQPADGDMF